MRVLVTGDREWDDQRIVNMVLDGAFDHDLRMTLIEGCAKGADSCAEVWADDASATHEHYPAQWDKYGRAAGPIRNRQMLEEGKPDVVIAFHDDLSKSKGTRDMIDQAKRAGLPVYLVSHA